MIKNTELRIGNWIQYNNRFWQVGSITDFPTIGISDSNEECLLNEELSIPIPLTPEILQKLGFRFSPCGISGADMWQGMSFWCKDDFLLRGNISTAKGGVLCLAGYFNSSVKYLHQLQNLYFCITGKELECSLNGN